MAVFGHLSYFCMYSNDLEENSILSSTIWKFADNLTVFTMDNYFVEKQSLQYYFGKLIRPMLFNWESCDPKYACNRYISRQPNGVGPILSKTIRTTTTYLAPVNARLLLYRTST